MNLYEHTIIAKQDTSPAQLKQLTEKYSKLEPTQSEPEPSKVALLFVVVLNSFFFAITKYSCSYIV